jgi:hypothetical protein
LKSLSVDELILFSADHMIHGAEIQIKERLGGGNFGDVYRGMFHLCKFHYSLLKLITWKIFE